MSNIFFALSVSAVFFLFACQKSPSTGDVSPLSVNAPTAKASGLDTDSDPDAKYTRVNVLRMTLEGYKDLAKKVMSFDVGVKEKVDTKGDLTCTLLKVRDNKPAANEAWTPFDFYGNAITDKDKKIGAANASIRRNIFFEGDDNNRNGAQDAVEMTVPPHTAFAQSLRFGHFQPDKDQFQFYLQFSRGTRNDRGLLQFSGLLGAKAYAGVLDGKNLCWARAILCTHYAEDAQGAPFCSITAEHPAYEVYRIRAQFDYPAAIKDSITGVDDERLKHDIKELIADVRPLDSDGRPTGKVKAISLAKKIYYRNSENSFEAVEIP